MKGIFFEKPYEFNIEIEGESWSQGDKVKGNLVVRNHGSDQLDLSDLGVTLALTDIKKFKALNPKGIAVLESFTFEPGKTLSPEGRENLEFEFQLTEDCNITEKASSLYVNCGNIKDPFVGGHLQLNVKPMKAINDFLEIFENFFKFKVKTIKNKKGFIDVKLSAPDSKDFGAVEQLNLFMNMDGDQLNLKYLFKVKTLAYDGGNVTTKTEIKEFNQELAKRQYSSFGDSPNQDGIIEALSSIMEEIKSKKLL